MDYIPEEKKSTKPEAQKTKFFSAENKSLKNIAYFLIAVLTIYLTTKTGSKILGVDLWQRPEYWLVLMGVFGILIIQWTQKKISAGIVAQIIKVCVIIIIVQLAINTFYAGLSPNAKELNFKEAGAMMKEGTKSGDITERSFTIPNDGRHYQTIFVPDQTLAKFDSNHEFFIVEGQGDSKKETKLRLIYVPMPAGKSSRYCTWGGVLWIMAKEHDTVIKVSY